MFFSIKEAFRLIGRAKASFILSLISLTISVTLITASIALLKASELIQNKIKENVTINLFLEDSLSSKNISSIESELQNKNYTKTVIFISKDKAAEIFIRETGEDFRQLLDFNPLPASFTLTLNGKYFDKDSLNKIVASLSEIKGVNDIGFKDEFIYKLISILNNLKKYIFIFTAVILLISIYIVYSTVRLIVSSKFEELETMKLVGAKLGTIKLPVILNSVLIGLLAGVLSACFFVLFISYFGDYFNALKILGSSQYIYLAFIICLGPLLGFIVSNISLKRLTLRI
jgi:cell division transport system permease protein